jgi:hypothetical protein
MSTYTRPAPTLARVRAKHPDYCATVSPLENDDWATGFRIVVADTKARQLVKVDRASVAIADVDGSGLKPWALVVLGGVKLRIPVEFSSSSRGN